MSKQSFVIALALSALVLGTLAAGPLQAAYNVSVNTGTQYSTGFVGSFEPTGAQMDGLKVTATFQGGGTNTALWADTSATGGAAAGTGWSLGLNGDTFGNVWTLNVSDANLVMTKLRIEGGNFGKTVFDLKDLGSAVNGPVLPGQGTTNTGTTGSMHGWTFEFFNQSAYQSGGFTLNIDAEYSNIVSLAASSPVGDIWSVLELSFGGTHNGLPSGFPVQFYADTDIIDELIPTNESLPEPTSLALFGGLAIAGGWGCWKRRKRNS